MIKGWGHYKTGDIIKNPSPTTVKALVETHKVAEVEIEKEVEVIEEEIAKEEKEKEESAGVAEEIVEAKEDRAMTEEEIEEEAKIDKEASEEVKEEVKVEEETVESYSPPKKKTASKEVSKKSK